MYHAMPGLDDEGYPPNDPVGFWAWLLYWGHGRVAVIVIFGLGSIMGLIILGLISLVTSLI